MSDGFDALTALRASVTDHLAGHREEALSRCYEMGRRMVAAGEGFMAVVGAMREVLGELAERPLSAEQLRGRNEAAWECFQEWLAPYEVAARGYIETGNLQEHRGRLEEEVQRRTADLERTVAMLTKAVRERQRLTVRLVRAQEEERQRIAGDVHDDPVQVMGAVQMRLYALRQKLEDPARVAETDAIAAEVQLAVERLRALMFEMSARGLATSGLAATIEDYLVRTFPEGIDYQLVNRMDSEPELSLRTILYRIVQEALINVRKHARASQVAVTLESNGSGYHAEVSDNGVGFNIAAAPPPGHHVGLAMMKERAEGWSGSLVVRSQRCMGTRVLAMLPSPPD